MEHDCELRAYRGSVANMSVFCLPLIQEIFGRLHTVLAGGARNDRTDPAQQFGPVLFRNTLDYDGIPPTAFRVPSQSSRIAPSPVDRLRNTRRGVHCEMMQHACNWT